MPDHKVTLADIKGVASIADTTIKASYKEVYPYRREAIGELKDKLDPEKLA